MVALSADNVFSDLTIQKGVQSAGLRCIMAKNNKRKKGISCLGALLIFCMLLIAACTVTINLLFRNGAAPKILGNRLCYYTYDDMGERVPKGSLVIADEPDQVNMQDIVLYQNEQNEYRIAVASLIVDTSSNVPDQTAKTYYLTTVTNTQAVQAEENAIVGICKRRSPELGMLIGFLTGTIGLVVGLVLPCVILLLYVIAVLAHGKGNDTPNNNIEDEDTDLAFVKSIQQKQQKIAERDAERLAKERQNADDANPSDRKKSAASAPAPELGEEEIARLEEEEAARRAERIAAVRTHMESRRQTETPDGVPLYTTEIITKTHTLSIPKTTDHPVKKQPALKPTPTEDIPRLTATGHLQIPTAEQIEAERKEQDRLAAAQALAKAAQDAAFSEPAPKKEEPAPAPAPAKPVEAAPAKPAEPQKAPETPAKPAPAPAKPKKQRIASASFEDLMAFLDDEQKKL